jgi:alkylation response protein AidB-like acyl-CoA dehydrogenase
MNFTLGEDHILLRDSAHDFLRKEADLAPLLVPGAGVAQAGYASMWDKMSALGWPGLVIPQAYDGHGMDTIDLAMVVRECGRHLAAAPLFGTLAGTWALLAAGSEEQMRRLLPEVATGERTMALAVAAPDGDCAPGNREVRATASGGGFSLNGSAHFVVDAAHASTLVVAALHESHVRWFLVEREAPGVQVQLLDWRDITRQVCGIRLANAQAQLLPVAAHLQAWPWVRDRLWLVLAAESAGGLQAVLHETAAYARERIAFGKPIGSYQAIKHQLADMLAQAECAGTAVLYAAWALSQESNPQRRWLPPWPSRWPAMPIATPPTAVSRSSAPSASPGK